MACIAWLGIRLFPPSMCDVQVGSLERALLQERSIVRITVQWFKGPTNAKVNLGIGKVSDASVQVMRSARPKWASSVR